MFGGYICVCAERQMVEGLKETLNLFHSFFCMIILISELSTALGVPLLEHLTRTKARDCFFLGAGWGDSDWWRWIVLLSTWAENVLRPDANTPQGLRVPWVQTLQSSLELVMRITRRHRCSYSERQRQTGN